MSLWTKYYDQEIAINFHHLPFRPEFRAEYSESGEPGYPRGWLSLVNYYELLVEITTGLPDDWLWTYLSRGLNLPLTSLEIIKYHIAGMKTHEKELLDKAYLNMQVFAGQRPSFRPKFPKKKEWIERSGSRLEMFRTLNINGETDILGNGPIPKGHFRSPPLDICLVQQNLRTLREWFMKMNCEWAVHGLARGDVIGVMGEIKIDKYGPILRGKTKQVYLAVREQLMFMQEHCF